ncbi:hypothetical protein [Geodermatophilus sp. DSM 44513]|uniref:hypothetical protein n=1 Tax=Geodermatophilus sp. DSM 44513 TaxID=1528104 RepID=UPI0012867829|nr:hypothetical protein [Geodermatophilus sp. DSM 44513]WNV75136.1 hypothetical protein RTG05_19420 [Geodermatophilus sp. DSM 44513]
MDGSTRPSPARRLRASVTQLALVTVLAGAVLAATPGTAEARGQVQPTLDCARANPDGTHTVVFGYTNKTAQSVTIRVGRENKITPKRHDGKQPTTFAAGEQRGAYSITVNAKEWRHGASWALDGHTVSVGPNGVYGGSSSKATTCPSSTELPEEGNGTGPAIVLVLAGVVGGVAVHRVNRRARDLAARSGGDA